MTYRELHRSAQAVAIQLSDSAERGSRALLLYPQGIDFLIAFFGCLQAGIIPVPLPPPDAARMLRSLPRLKSVITDSQAALVLTTRELFATLHEHFDAEFWLVAANAAEPVREETQRAFYEAFKDCGLRDSALAPAYGLAEATLMVSHTRLEISNLKSQI